MPETSDDLQISFSVVIPAYNAAATIERAIRSCLEQSYPPKEIIVIDDASTDNTAALVKQLFSSEVMFIQLRENSGPGHARNIGLDKASGTYIAFQDADDVWHKDKLRIVTDMLQAHPAVKFLYHPYTLSGMDYNAFDGREISLKPYSMSRLLWSNPIGTPCTIMINDPQLRFDESMRYMEDYDLWLHTGNKYGIFFLNLALTQINRPILSAGGQSSNRNLMRRGEMKAYLNLAKRDKLYFLLLPALAGFSILKHFIKSFFPPRSNY
ncbi:glycosyltransferase family 2 protein [Chitinophagaceae bacterium MMS25-I14]